MIEIPTPETLSRYQNGDDMFAVSQDLERRLTIAREALNGLNKLNLCGRAYEEIEAALTLTAPKP
jgi:hypothetical protein